ncbi:hypothetical protein NW762_011059 [Fusarium torreyae]|uniref:Uncharacterized protein n=1 Tax=Fusarium torreyae TaxID=1237075 RepID=A0A9W8VB17_9HYPO|nr:hypothetical protein NW762_011059 [Fusarium torreyae]
MAGAIEEMIDLVWSPGRVKRKHRNRKHPDNFQYYRRWGFTIYRTYYGPDTDKYWNMLLYALEKQISLALGYYENNEDAEDDIDPSDLQRLNRLFCLDVRDNASVLDHLDVQGIKELWQREEPKNEGAMADNLYKFILLADESVLKDIANGEFIVKAIALHWVEGHSGWGWMRIPSGYLLELFQTLMRWEYETYKTLRFSGSEQDLKDHVWPGDMAIQPTGKASEIRPLLKHYSGQSLDYAW